MHDVAIIGGSYSGLSAAMAMGRSMRNVLIVDSGKPCNRQTPHSHNFITHDGEAPAVIAQKAKEQVLKYDTVEWMNDTVTFANKSENGFALQTTNGKNIEAKKLVFATGLRDIMPPIAGFAACWGISVLHCPYCHGYEVRNQPPGIIANGDAAFEFARMISHWSKNLTLFCNGTSTLNSEQTQKLSGHSIAINQKEIREMVHVNGQLQHLVFGDGSTQKIKAVFTRPAFEQHCTLPVGLGCPLTETGLLAVDGFQKTSVAGMYAAGDSATLFRAISVAVAAGALAGAMLNKELIEEAF